MFGKRAAGKRVDQRVVRAARTMVECLERRVMLNATARVPAWVEQGPAPLFDSIGTPSLHTGAVEAIASPRPFDRIVYAASVNGGVWRTKNSLATSPDWEPLTDNLRSMSMGAIAISRFVNNFSDPEAGIERIDSLNIVNTNTDLLADKLTVYAGFSRVSSGGQDGGQQRGLIWSSKGGKPGTWQLLAFNQLKGLQIRAIVPSEVHHNVIYVAAQDLSRKSSNEGVWKITIGATPQAHKFEQVLGGHVTHLIGVPGSNDTLYVGIPGTTSSVLEGIFRTNDGSGGTTGWHPVDTGLGPTSRRIELASSRNSVFAALITGTGTPNSKVDSIYRWNETTSRWNAIPNTPNVNPGGQADLHFSMAADPSDANVVVVAGDRSTHGRHGGVFRADLSKSGNPWEEVVAAGANAGGLPTAPHADSRDMFFLESGHLLESDDGGVYILEFPHDATKRVWKSKNGDLGATEFFSIAYDSLNEALFGGLQDNDVVEQPPPPGGVFGIKRWSNVPVGDGTYVGVYNQDATKTTRYISALNFGHFQRREFTDLRGVFPSTTVTPGPLEVVGSSGRRLNGPGIMKHGTGALVFDNALWPLAQYAVNAADPMRLLFGTDVLYESTDGGKTVVAMNGLDFSRATDAKNDDGDANAGVDLDEVTPKPVGLGGTFTAMVYGAPGKPHVAWVAQQSALWARETRTHGDFRDFTLQASYPGAVVRDIAMDETDWKKIYVLDTNSNIFFHDFATAASVNITGDLGKRSNDIRTVEVIKTGRADVPTIVLAGGQGGVFYTKNPGASAKWFRLGDKLPNTIIKDLHYDHSRNQSVLYAGTWGRGAWKITNFLSTFFASGAPDTGPSFAALERESFSDERFVGPLPQMDPYPHSPATSWEPAEEQTRLASLGERNVALQLVAGDPGVLEIVGDELADKNDTIRLALDPANPDILNLFLNNTTDEPDFSIDAAAIEKVIVTGGEGDDSLLIDHANGLVSIAEGIDFDEAGPGTDTRQEVNLTPLNAGIVAKIRGGLEAVAGWASSLTQLAEATAALPGLGISLADTLAVGDGSSPIGGALLQGLVNPIKDFLTNDATPTAQELSDLMRSLSKPLGNVHFSVDPLSVGGGLFTNELNQQELRFDLALQLKGYSAQLPLDFGASVESLGLNFSSGGTIDLSTSFNFDLSFGVDLTPGLSDADAFFIRTNNLSATARVSAGTLPTGRNDEVPETIIPGVGRFKAGAGPHTDFAAGAALNFDLQLGFLQASVRDGQLDLDATVRLDMVNPDDDPLGNITLAELQGTSLSNLLDVSVDGKLDATLPLQVSLAGVSSAEPVIKITSNDLFGSVPTVTTENFDNLLNFDNLSADGMLALLRQLAEALGRISDTDVLAVNIPLTSKTVGDALDFAQAITENLIDPLADPNNPNAARFSSAQDLGVKLAEVLGLDPSIVNASYDPATSDLTYHVSLSKAFTTGDANVDLGLDLDALGGISTDGKFVLDATAGADFVFGVNLAPLGADETLADRFFIADATLSGSVNLNITDLDAEAKIGFLGVGVENGTASLTASAAIELQNPSVTPDSFVGTAALIEPRRRLTLPELLSNLLNNPAGLVAPPRTVSITPGGNVNITNKAKNQNEPVIVIDPTNPQRLFMASNNELGGSMTAAYSTNGGASWTQREIATGLSGDGFEAGCCDPAATWDRFGNLYFAYLNSAKTKVTILLSTDGGQSFTLLKDFTTVKLDRPVLGTGPGDTPDSATVWVAMTDAGVAIQVSGARVTGAGAANIGAFSTPQTVPGTGLGNFPDVTVGPKGQVMVTWQTADPNPAGLDGPADIFVSVDPDGLGPQGFGPAQLVINTKVGPKDGIPPQPDRKITADPHIEYALAGSHIGRVYIVYTDERMDGTNETGDTDVYVRYSDKDGAEGSWSKPTRVNDPGNLSAQFFPHLAVDQKTGHLAVSWYDARNDVQNKKVELWATVSTNGGASFEPNVRISTDQSDQALSPAPAAADIDYGDYTGLAFHNGVFYPAWADNSATADKSFDIYTAKVTVASLSGTPDTFAPPAVTAANGPIQFQGSASANLPITITGFPITLDADAKVTLDWTDLSDLNTLDVDFVKLDDALNFEGLDFDAILAALQKVVDYLSELQGFGFLNEEIPLVGVSVSDLFDYADQFNQKLQQLRSNPVGTIQLLEDEIESAFGLDDSELELSIDGDNLKTELKFVSNPDPISRNLNFNIDSLLANATGPVANLAGLVDISGSADLTVDVDTELNLVLGIDLSNPLAPTPFIYDDSKITIDATLSAPDLNLTVALGPLGAKIAHGSAALRHRDNNDPARFAVTLDDSDGDGKHAFDGKLFDDVNVDLAARVDVNLPIEFPIGDLLTPNLVIRIPDLEALLNGDADSVQIVSAPDLSQFLEDLDLLNDLSGLLDGLDQLLALLQSTLDSKAFSRPLPLVGTKLKDGAQVIGDFRTEVINRLRPIFEAASPKSVTYVQQALVDVLGNGTGGLDLLQDLNNDGKIDIGDVPVTLDNPTTPNDVRFDFHLRKEAEVLSLPIDLDLNLPALQLETDGDVEVEAGFDFHVGIGLDRGGVYFDTTAADELLVDVGVGIEGFTGVGSLAFLQVDVADDSNDASRLDGKFTVDLADSNGKLRIGEFGDASIDAHFDATADINLDLAVSFGGSSEFPRLFSDLNIDWEFNNDTTDATFGAAPDVAFESIRLDLGSFFNDFARPILGRIETILSPLQPIIDFLETDIPMLARIDSVRNFFDRNGNKVVTVREVIATLDPNPVFDFLDGIIALSNLVDSIPASSTFQLNLGRFDLNNVADLRALPNLEGVTLTNLTEANVNAQLQATSPAFASAVADPDLGKPGGGGGKFELPLLKSPASVFKLFLGQDVDLFRWDMPALELNLEIHKTFPLIGPIGVSFGGGVNIKADAAFGFDTFGLRQWRQTGQESDILDGFFLLDKPAGSADDPAEISATGKITIGAGFDAIIVSARVEGSLLGTLELNLNNPDNDAEGKVRFEELSDNLDQGLLCIFDIEGSLSAQLSAHASVGVWPFKKSFHYDSPLLTLLTFEHECKDDPTQADPILATDLGDGLLLLNMGPFAANRLTVNTTDGAEDFVVEPDPDVAGNVRVSALGYSQSFAGINQIRAAGGLENDSIFVDPALNVKTRFGGDAGNDTLTAGAGDATLNGGDGDDALTGRGGNDGISGGIGNDILVAGAGHDSAHGGAGIDQIYGEDGNDLLTGADDNDNMLGGPGNDTMFGSAGNDNLEGEEGNDVMHGEAGDDEMNGGAGTDSMTGGDGLDLIAGDVGADTIEGGNDADQLDGGDDADSITGGGGNDTAAGQGGNDNLAGNDGDDNLTAGEGNDTASGDAGNDVILGEGGDDSLAGGTGNDLIEGGEGKDTIGGGDDNDTARGGSGNDAITGGEGNDQLFGDADADHISGNAGNDSIEGGTGLDALFGNAGEDFIVGQEDADAIEGGASDDTMFGGAGDDVVIGGATSVADLGGLLDGDDLAQGDTGDDVILGDNGQASGAGSFQTTTGGGSGSDTAYGGAGNDVLVGGGAGDLLVGDASTSTGDDILIGDQGDSSTAAGERTMRALHSETAGSAGNDTMEGSGGADAMLGGDGNDLVNGDGITPELAGADVAFGDNGILRYDVSSAIPQLVQITSSELTHGGSDTINTGGGDDTAIGGTAGDQITGGADDDDLIGGHNVAGGADGADTADGGAGTDVLAGDNASIVRRADGANPTLRQLSGARIYNADGTPAVTGDFQLDPTIASGRDITLFDHATTADASTHGNDQLSGGGGKDSVFGQLGNDILRGDTGPGGTDDGDDYVEGNGGNDQIHGDLGQDDLIGGSSDLFGLATSDARPDGADVIFGGTGGDVARNSAGDTAPEGHARDADVIVGDNGTIYRLVNASGEFLSFNYDIYGALKIIPRGVKALDPVVGGADLVHGEAGDDEIHGQAGNDVLFGDAQDDNVYGGQGHDRMYGGMGEDGILGDEGRFLVSRNGLAEPLNGIDTASSEVLIETSGNSTGSWENITGRLNKVALLSNLTVGGNDVMYGGLGDDFMHGGAGDDGISGAEAVAAFYNDSPVSNTNPLGYDPVTRKLAAYDANNPLLKIAGFFLNFDATDAGAKVDDGKDRIFGNHGHDWLVGGTGHDRLFGGLGDDLLNADDNHDTAGGLNNGPDAPLYADADFAFGGAGLDVMIANTGAERIFDWFGEFNTYVVPFNPFGIPTTVRIPSPSLIQFLLDLGRYSGADQALVEPAGELGLTTSGETGPPRDPQKPHKARRDTTGGIEDDRDTAIPLP